MVRESEVEAYLVKRVKELGGEIRKVKWIGRKNAPDRRVMLLRPGHMPCWVELKRPGERPTGSQVREHERMRRQGEIVHVIDSVAGVDKLLRDK